MGEAKVVEQISLPIVTIMIPTYNQAEFIVDAINSALAQTYSNLEVIVGDDSSTDNTSEVVSRIKDPRLRYIRNKSNIGRVANYRNILYNYASGDYVLNLDGDDYYTDVDFISEAVRLLVCDRDAVMVVARATAKNGKFENTSNIPAHNQLTGMQILKRLPHSKYLMMHMAVMYVRKTAIELGFYRVNAISSDWESLYRLSLRGPVKYLDRNVGIWRIHGNNQTVVASNADFFVNMAIWSSVYKEAIYYGMNSWLAIFLSARCVAYSAQINCQKLSMKGNFEVLKFLLSAFKSNKLSALVFIFTPFYLGRVILCLLGHYRRKCAP